MMHRVLILTALLTLATAPVIAAADSADSFVDHPDKLKFSKLDYAPPKPGDYRHELKSGSNAYVAESREVPTFDLTIRYIYSPQS